MGEDNNSTPGYVTAQQVADLAGVSRSAVSRTFNKGTSVSASTRDKVMHAAEQLGYHVNQLARSLMNEQSNIVCILSPDVNSPYQARFIEALTRQLQGAGKVSMLVNTSAEVGVAQALRQTLHYRADATIVLSGQPEASMIQSCIANGQRVIVANRDNEISDADNLSVTNRVASRYALQMLRRAKCKNLALISSELGTPSLVARETAFLEEAEKENIPVTVQRAGATSYQSGYRSAQRMFSTPDAPDGAYCVTDLLACGFMDAARTEFDIKIPEELCVVGFDDIDQAGWSSYNLTTFRQPLEDITTYIVDLVCQPFDGRTHDIPTRFPAIPIWRKTVRPR